MDYKKAQHNFAPLFKPVSALYAATMHLRAKAYAAGIKTSQSPKAFCVAIGNIAWGGSGKTPISDWILTWAHEQGLVTALLTRGYGGKSEERPLLVKAHSNPDESGDEPLMLARKHPESYVLADPKRRRALDWLEAHTTANFIVLDDAMQHLAVRRDLNLILLRAKDISDAYWNKVIPAGEWREGAYALQRASAFMLRMSPEAFTDATPIIKKRLTTFQKPLFSFYLKPASLTALASPDSGSKDLQGREYLLCTGVGSPEEVQKSAEELLGYPPSASVYFPDHHKFTSEDLKKLSKAKLPIVMTAKDAVKIEPLLLERSTQEAYVLESEVHFGPAMFCSEDFPTWLSSRWHELS